MLSDIARAYIVLILAAGTFGLLSIACSSYFRRTSSALVVSYLVILPLALLCVVLTAPVTRSADPPPLRGYSADSSRVEREWEAKFRAIPDPALLRSYMQRLSARPQ